MVSDSPVGLGISALIARGIQLAGDERTRDSDEYWDVVRLLHRRPERAVFERAVACCTAPTAVERLVGADVLAQIGPVEPGGSRPFTHDTVPVLRGLLGDHSDAVVAAALHALGHHQYLSIEDVRPFVHHSSQAVREALAHALTGHDESDAIALLLELMTDADDTVRDWATFAIGSQCGADGLHVRHALTERLADSSEEIRGEAMVGLARRRDASVVDDVARALNSPMPGQLVFDAAEELLTAFPEDGRIRAALAKWRTG